MVLTQQKAWNTMAKADVCFHTTMVLTQRESYGFQDEHSSFPYHYGSHATGMLSVPWKRK